jgi:hypothetical protein
MIRGSLFIREKTGGGIRVVCSVPLSEANGTEDRPNHQNELKNHKD